MFNINVFPIYKWFYVNYLHVLLPIDCKQTPPLRHPRYGENLWFSCWSMDAGHPILPLTYPPVCKKGRGEIEGGFTTVKMSFLTLLLTQSPNFITFIIFFSLSLNRVSCCWVVPWNQCNFPHQYWPPKASMQNRKLRLLPHANFPRHIFHLGNAQTYREHHVEVDSVLLPGEKVTICSVSPGGIGM